MFVQMRGTHPLVSALASEGYEVKQSDHERYFEPVLRPWPVFRLRVNKLGGGVWFSACRKYDAVSLWMLCDKDAPLPAELALELASMLEAMCR